MEVCFAKEKVIKNLIKNLLTVLRACKYRDKKKWEEKDRAKLEWSGHGTVERFKEAL